MKTTNDAIKRIIEKYRNSFLYKISSIKKEINIEIVGIEKRKKGITKSEYLEDGFIRFV